MVEINNLKRKAFLDMLAWSEELITDVRKPVWVPDVIVGGELFLRSARSPVKLVAKPKTQSMTPDATSFFPVGGMPTANSLA